MTERYDRQKVNSRHCVLFSKPKINDDLFYYDFDTHEWREVIPLDNLPYGLCIYKFVDEDDESRCVVTCRDSYRLSTKPDTDDAELEKERQWRDQIVNGTEVEYVDPKKGTAQRAKVLWFKSDIIPGVVYCGPHKRPNVNGWYIYKESLRLAKRGSHIPLLTDEELAEEQCTKEKAEERYNKWQDTVQSWKDKLPYISCEKYADSTFFMGGSVRVYDTREYWRSVKKYPNEITVKSILDWCIENHKDGEKVENIEKNKEIEVYKDTVQLCILGEATVAKDYEASFIRREILVPQNDQKPPVKLSDFDFIFDIKVHDATFAYMHCGDLDPNGEWGRHFDMIKVNNVFTFPDITYENPLHQAQSGSTFWFYTDGSRITYKAGWKYMDVNRLMAEMSNWTINELQGKLLLNGHMWAPSVSFPVEDIIEVPRPQQKNED